MPPPLILNRWFFSEAISPLKNKPADCCNDRITLGGGTLSLQRADGVTAASMLVPHSGPYTSWYVNNITLPPPAVTPDNANDYQKLMGVKTVNIQSAPNQFLHFKVGWGGRILPRLL